MLVWVVINSLFRHIISGKGVAADSGKVEAIVKASAPANVSALRKFLGLIQYVGRYIPDLTSSVERVDSKFSAI